MKSYEWYEMDTLVARVEYEGDWPKAHLVSYEVFSDDVVAWPLGEASDVELNHSFEVRLMPRKNFTTEVQQWFGKSVYNAEELCRISHGAMPHDAFWMKFEDDENLRWQDVSVQ